MALLTVQKNALAGVVVAPVAAAGGGDSFPNDGKTVLEVVNGGGSPITVTIAAPVNCNQGTNHPGGGSVTNGTTKRFGPFDQARWNDASGNVVVTYSAVTSVTVAAVGQP